MKNFYFILVLPLLFFYTGLKAQVNESDSLALVDIYNAAGGPNWTDQMNWLTDPVSNWTGVTVDDSTGRVTGLELSLNNMSGTISPSIGNLTELTILRMNGDEDTEEYVDIYGSIPSELWNCTKLERLQIKFTKITGDIPDGIESMTALYEINFQGTKLGCEIPEELFELPSLTKAYLHESNFTGTVPSTLSDATNLVRLYLQGNHLSAGLPFVDLSGNDAKVELTGNYFTFEDVKPYHDYADSLKKLTDEYQLAQDTINVSLSHGDSYTLDGTVENGVDYAWLKDEASAPVSREAQYTLSDIQAGDRGLYTCKAENTNMVNNFNIRTVINLDVELNAETDSLALVDIYNAAGGPNWSDVYSWLNGPVSDWTSVTVDSTGRVTELVLTDTLMSGTISSSIGNLTELTKLEIKGDEDSRTYVDIHGSIPSELWNCTKIYRLQLKFTKLTGDIPDGIENMTALSEINFQGTKLGCEIPEELFELPSLTKAYLHESNFTGTVPSTLSDATNLVRLYLQGNHLSAGLPYVDLSGNDAKVELTGNYFTFEDVKQYHDNAANLKKLTDEYQFAQDTTEVTADLGSAYTFSLSVPDGKDYNWFKDNISSSIASDSTYTIASVSKTDQGNYVCKVQNTDMVENFDVRAAFIFNGGTVIPAVVSAETTTGGDSILVTFDSEMADPSADTSNFTISAEGKTIAVSSASLSTSDSSVIVLSLVSAIESGDIVTVSYTPGTLEGSTGGAVLAFGPESVTNNVGTGISNVSLIPKVFPNPFNETLSISSENVIETIEIFNLAGCKIYTDNSVNSNSVVINTCSFKQGVYMLKIVSDGKASISKIIKN